MDLIWRKPLGDWRRLAASGLDPFVAGKWPISSAESAPYEGLSYLPLEAFRGAAEGSGPQGGEAVRTFLSSGTTRETRSVSRFSAVGLDAYREQSLYVFKHVLGRVLPVPPSEARGISLIPPVETWTDSSLAQMVAWAAAELPVVYAEGAGFAAAVRAGAGPVWVFGTAFHLLNLIDDGFATVLPEGSIVVETGGTKGKAREVTRRALYSEIAGAFGIQEAAIVSEYGMCELACQAYDFVPRGAAYDWEERRFRFPAWIRTAALVGPGKKARTGRGALVVDDPLRVDFPWPLRTEDLAEVEADGGFRLLGRAPVAPLKGCSLLAEQVVHTKDFVSPAPTASTSGQRTVAWDADAAARRASSLNGAVQTFIAAASTRELLAAEFGSETAAAAALADLASGLPETERAWAEAAGAAVGQASCPARWLFILPENHSLVGLYPLALAYAAGLTVVVRVPARFATAENCLGAFLQTLAALPDAHVTTVGAALRVGTPGTPPHDAVLVYGSDETVLALRRATNAPVQGFGNKIGVSIVREDDLAANADALARDVLGLGQSGCMSTRLVLMLSEKPRKETAARLIDAALRFWQAPLPWKARVGLDFEAFRLKRLGFDVTLPSQERTPLLAFRDVAAESLINDSLIRNSIARAPFTFPVLRVHCKDDTAFVKTALMRLAAVLELGTLTADLAQTAAFHVFSLTKSDYRALSFRPLGAANAPRWDGSHDGRALFIPSF